MALSDSMFLVEIIVEELRSFVKCKDFLIQSQFADVFSIILKDPNELEKVLPKIQTKKHYKRKKRNSKPLLSKPPLESKVQAGQSILFAHNIDNLISNMRKYPIELSLWSAVYPEYKIASTSIPWNANCIEYLNKINMKREPQPVSTKGEYNVFDEYTSRRMAIIKLNIKLTYLSDKITTQFRSLSEENPDTFMYTGFNSKPSTILSTVQDRPFNLAEETGIIKTIYSGGKKHKKSSRNKIKTLRAPPDVPMKETKTPSQDMIDKIEVITNSKKMNSSIISLVKSDTDIEKNKSVDLVKVQSCSSMNADHLNILNYIFGDNTGPFGNQVYCVGYFTVENENSSPKSSPKSSSGPGDASEKSGERFKFRLCDTECMNKKNDSSSRGISVCSIDLPKELSDMTTVIKCKQVDCAHKKFRELPSPPDERILLDLTSLKQDCCEHKTEKGDKVEKVEEVVGGMKAKMKLGEDPCYCECECRFGFMKKTTYCKICGGYEKAGEDHEGLPQYNAPFPCPIYHKLDKPKQKATSIGSDTRKSSKMKSATDKSIESEKEAKKGKKKKKEDKFKFNYGYTAPQIGHSHCALPCTGTLGQVPKNMGWLWTADNIPGMKFRPLWKPGAVNKHVLRMLKYAKNPGEVFAKKKRRKDSSKAKRPLKRPLLVVHKKDGEYTVTMETMKAYAKPRALNQVPFEDKPALTYTIGRTEEENKLRRQKKERAQRRLERNQRQFIQSAFRDMCQEICLKTYQQALGILPDTEDPDCTCYPAEPGPDRTDLEHSCSCSEDSNLTGSATDSDEWVVEFTPPTATFDPSYKSKKIAFSDVGTQYTYLDYRVKLLDRYGNPVPRFFRGSDGREQCSDLGGFWGADKKWLEINVDGYVAPDGKWAPNVFIGPNGENVDAELGKFQAMDGSWLVVGIDGYVDVHGRWRFYSKVKATPVPKKRRSVFVISKKGPGDKAKQDKLAKKKSEGTWSCFGDVSPKHLSEMGIVGHGHDRKLLLDTLNKLIAQGENVKIPEPSTVPRSHRKGRRHVPRSVFHDFANDRKCRHASPSDKGIVAVDAQGNKTYFRLKRFDNTRPKQRIVTLTDQGISVSSFHVPCFHSFISTEMLKKQQYKRLAAMAKGREGQGRQQGAQANRPEPRYRNVVV